jgi:hypothetical protein
MPLEQPAWTVFGLPLRLDQTTGQRAFALFIFFTFLNFPDFRMHAVVLVVIAYFAIRNSR